MNLIYILLFLIALFLYLLYDKIKKLYEVFTSENDESEEFTYQPKTIKDKLNKIALKTSNIEYYIANDLQELITSENPAGSGTHKHRKLENLVKLYTKFLIQKEKMNEQQALAKARFCIYYLGEREISTIIHDIDYGFEDSQKARAEEEYYDSKLLDKEIAEYWDVEVAGVKKISPYYLFAPMYNLLKKQNYTVGKNIKTFLEHKSYYDFVKNHAIISKLEKIGVIKKVNNATWGVRVGDEPLWTVPNTDLAKLKDKIYEGGEGHDDDYFEEKFREGSLEKIFVLEDDMYPYI